MKKRRSQIARLPRIIREELNSMLDEGATYREIIQWLTKKGHSGINENVLFHWRRGGYVDWCEERARREQSAALRQWAATLADNNDHQLLPRAVAHFSAVRLYRLLSAIDIGDLAGALESRPEHVARYFNTLIRTGKMCLDAQKLASHPHPSPPVSEPGTARASACLAEASERGKVPASPAPPESTAPPNFRVV